MGGNQQEFINLLNNSNKNNINTIFKPTIKLRDLFPPFKDKTFKSCARTPHYTICMGSHTNHSEHKHVKIYILTSKYRET